VATISRRRNIIGLACKKNPIKETIFCKRDLYFQWAYERSHPIWPCVISLIYFLLLRNAWRDSFIAFFWDMCDIIQPYCAICPMTLCEMTFLFPSSAKFVTWLVHTVQKRLNQIWDINHCDMRHDSPNWHTCVPKHPTRMSLPCGLAIHIYLYTCIGYTCIHIYTRIYIYTYIYIYNKHIRTYTYIYMYICKEIWKLTLKSTYIQKHKDTYAHNNKHVRIQTP